MFSLVVDFVTKLIHMKEICTQAETTVEHSPERSCLIGEL